MSKEDMYDNQRLGWQGVVALVVLVLITAGLLLAFAQSRAVKMQMDFDKAQPAYAKGVNDALDTIMLLDLEQELQGTNRTWGAMAEIVCERLRVERK